MFAPHGKTDQKDDSDKLEHWTNSLTRSRVDQPLCSRDSEAKGDNTQADIYIYLVRAAQAHYQNGHAGYVKLE